MASTLVIGARGTIGRLVVQGLLAAGQPVRASVRDLATADFDERVEVVQADLGKPESLRPALDGVASVFLYASRATAAGFSAAARQAGVEHVVPLSSGSVLLPWAARENAISIEHSDIEQALMTTGLHVTPIRPLVLASNALNWARSIRRDRSVELVHPDSMSAPVHEADIAAVAVSALTGAAAAEAAGLLTGSEVLTQRRQVELIGEALGEPVRVEEITEQRAREKLAEFEEPETVEAVLAFISRNVREGESPATSVARTVLGRDPLPFARWVEEHVDAFR